MSAIAGVDYSTKAVHGAIVAGKQLRFVKRYDLGGERLRAIVALVSDMQRRGAHTMYLEQPFFVPARLDKETGRIKQGSNVNTLKLHQVASEVETIARLKGMEVAKVAPATWKAAILKGVPGATTKERSLWFVKHVWALETRDDNKADAICLATYGEALARFKGIIPPAIEVR